MLSNTVILSQRRKRLNNVPGVPASFGTHPGEVLLQREDRGPDVERSGFLPEARPRHGRDPGAVEELEAVEDVGRLAGLRRGLDRPLR